MNHLIKGLTFVSMALLCSCTRDFYAAQQVLNHQKTNHEQKIPGDTTEQGFYNANNYHVVLGNTLTPLSNGFAHNDYIHKRPLFEALENGFTNIEVDIFLLNGKLIVAHISPYFKGRRTLKSLYLQPLMDRITHNGGTVFTGYKGAVTLMIDIKTNADKTYEALKVLLEKYRSILSGYENGIVNYQAVTIILSGHKPYGLIKNEQHRLAFIDADLCNMPANPLNNNIFAMASCKYSSIMKWNGNGIFPIAEKNRLCAIVAAAHKMGARVRLWASPEKKEVWDALLSCGVDLLNTDQLVELKNYLTLERAQKEPKSNDLNNEFDETNAELATLNR